MGSGRPTIHDVAARAGVSKSLVSLALRGSPRVSEESRAAILAAAADLGYRPNAAARSLAVRRSRTVGVLILDLHNPVFPEILDGVQDALRAHGFSTMLVTGGSDPALQQSEVESLLQFQVEGLILISHRLAPEVLRAIAAEVPTVVVTRSDVPGTRIDTVSNDDVVGAGLAVDHLVALGHRRIACLSGGDNPVSRARVQGYEAAMERHGLGRLVRTVPGGLTDTAGHDAARSALGTGTGPAPTALFVANDMAALGAVAAVQELGRRVPADVSVVGYDGIAMGGLRSVDLTTVAQPLGEMGETAARSLIHRIEHPRARARHVTLTPRLAVRGTTAPVAAARS